MATPVQDAHRETCRMVMGMAWASKRAKPVRTFSDCMKGAWRFAKRSMIAAARIMDQAARHGGRVRMRDMISRPNITAAIKAGQTTKARMFGSAHWR